MIEFLIACSPVITLPGMYGPPAGLRTNCGPGDIELVERVEERKESKVRIPTRHLNIIDWKINL
jgi:hypothetical protein